MVEQKVGFSWITMDEDRSSTVYKSMMIVLPHSDSPNAQDQQQQKRTSQEYQFLQGDHLRENPITKG